MSMYLSMYILVYKTHSYGIVVVYYLFDAVATGIHTYICTYYYMNY